MAYNSAIPQASDRIKDSQSAMLANFGAINGVLNVNAPYLDFSVAGAVPTLAAHHVGLINQGDQLCILKGAVATPFTGGTGGVLGWVRLPNGMLMKWAQVLGTGDFTFTWSIVMPGGTPDFTSVFHVQACPYVINPAFDVPTNRFVQVIGALTDPLTLRFYVSERTSMTAATAEISVFAIGY